MCHRMRRFERMAQEKKKRFHIRIFVKGLDFECDIYTDDPCLCIGSAWKVVHFLEINNVESTVEFSP